MVFGFVVAALQRERVRSTCVTNTKIVCFQTSIRHTFVGVWIRLDVNGDNINQVCAIFFVVVVVVCPLLNLGLATSLRFN